MRLTRLASWAVVPVGFLAAHVLAFVVSHPDRGWSAVEAACHGTPTPAVAVLFLTLLIGAAFAALRAGFRSDQFRLSFASSAIRMTMLFASIEMIEHFLGGRNAQSMAEPALWISFLAQLVVAGALVWILRLANRAGRLLARSIASAPIQATVPWICVERGFTSVVGAGSGLARAPPSATL